MKMMKNWVNKLLLKLAMKLEAKRLEKLGTKLIVLFFCLVSLCLFSGAAGLTFNRIER